MKKTNTGRVVYNRKPHIFKTSDVIRIMKDVLVTQRIKNVPPEKEFDADWVEMMTALLFLFALEKGFPAYESSIRNALQAMVYAINLPWANEALRVKRVLGGILNG